MSSQQYQQLGETIEQDPLFCITSTCCFAIVESVLSNFCYWRNISNSQRKAAVLLYLTMSSTLHKCQNARGERGAEAIFLRLPPRRISTQAPFGSTYMAQRQEKLAQTVDRFYAASTDAGSQQSNPSESGATGETLSFVVKQELHRDKLTTRVTELLVISVV